LNNRRMTIFLHKNLQKFSDGYYKQEGAASPVPPLPQHSSVATDISFETPIVSIKTS
jgi:hypothetical protein